MKLFGSSTIQCSEPKRAGMSVEPIAPPVTQPDQCQTMSEVRAGVDSVDRQLVALLTKRFAYMDAAARIKTTRDAVRDEARKMQVIDNVRAQAIALGLPEQLLARIWDDLVKGSIAYELERWNQLRS